jgi:hypothetical protein
MTMWQFVRALFLPRQGRPYPSWEEGFISYHGPVLAEPEIVAKAPAEFADKAGPDWLLHWMGCALPGRGGGFRVSLGVWESDLRGEGCVVCPISRSRPVAPKQFVADPESLHRILDRLHDSFPDRLVNARSQSIDGIPFELFVYRRNPFCGIRACCNLFDAMPGRRPAGQVCPPVFELGWLFWSLTGTVAPRDQGRGET